MDQVALKGSAESASWDRLHRRRALFRSWICPGAGFAFLGWRGAGLLTYAAFLGLFSAIIWCIFWPQAIAVWVVLGVFGIAAILSLTEQFACTWGKPVPRGEGFLVGRLAVATTLIWVALVGSLVLFICEIGSSRMAGAGMSPTLEKGERFLYSKRVDPGRHHRGAVIAYMLSKQSAWGQPGWFTVSRILAVPGDRLAVRKGSYIVNGEEGPTVAETRPYASVVRVPSWPDTITVPEGRYFIVQDDPRSAYDSQVLSWVEERSIVADRLYYFTTRGLLKPLE